MKKMIMLLTLSTTVIVSAALSPRYQNDKDKSAMMAFVKKHPLVESSFSHISVANQTVYFGEGCEAVFQRKVSFHLPGWVGPAEPLIFKDSTCPIE